MSSEKCSLPTWPERPLSEEEARNIKKHIGVHTGTKIFIFVDVKLKWNSSAIMTLVTFRGRMGTLVPSKL